MNHVLREQTIECVQIHFDTNHHTLHNYYNGNIIRFSVRNVYPVYAMLCAIRFDRVIENMSKLHANTFSIQSYED